MASTPEDITVEYEEDGKLLIKQLEKEVLTKGAWTTIIFMYQEMERQGETYQKPKVTIRRYKKSNGMYRQQSKFNISGFKQAKSLIDVLSRWLPKLSEEDEVEKHEHERESD